DETGSGIWFGGAVGTSTIDIGAGSNASDPSNFITVASTGGDASGLDGIHFEGTVGDGAAIVIDGNRIGYTGAPDIGTLGDDGVADDGISFNSVNGTANVR